MLVERPRPLESDWKRVRADVLFRRDTGAVARLERVDDPGQLPVLEEAARFWSTIDHPSQVRVVEVGLLEGRGYFLPEVPGESVASSAGAPLPLPRVLAFVEELLELLARGLAWRDDGGALRPMHAASLDAAAVYSHAGRLQILVGSPAPTHDSPARELEDVRALRALARRLLGGDDRTAALPGWGARLFKDNGMGVHDLLAAVRKVFEGPAAGLMRLDDVHRRVSRADLVEHGEWLGRLLSAAPEYARVPEITARAWAGLREHLEEALRDGACAAWHIQVLRHLPQAEPLLVEVLADADLPAPTRVEAAQVLGARRASTAAPALVAVLNEPLEPLQVAARQALAALAPAPHVAADPKKLRIVACSHSWESLEPIDPARGRARRWCADCAKPVVRVDDVEGLRAELGACAFFDGPDPDDVERRRKAEAAARPQTRGARLGMVALDD